MLGSAAKPFQLIRNDYSSVTVGTGAYVQLTASLIEHASELEIFDSSGSLLVLAYGKAGSENNLIYVMPGGNGRIGCLLSKGDRLAIKAVDTAATAGQIAINLYTK